MQYLLVQETFTGSISLTDDNSIKLGNQLPDSVRSRFRESYQNLVDCTSSTTAADFDEILLELVGDVVNSKLTILHAIGLLLTINFTDSMQVMKALADALWFWSTQLDATISSEVAGWNLLCSFVKELSAPPAAIDGVLLKTTLGLKLLVGAGLMTDEKLHTKKMSRIFTSLVYRQQKYNLLREETEGFSKLMVVLCSIPQYPEDVSQYVRQVLSLIGRFDLDPNRTVDVILDAFEQQIWNLSFITLLNNFSKVNIPHILGFKFTFYHSQPVIAEIETTAPAVTAAGGGKTAASKDINQSSKITIAPSLSGNNLAAAAQAVTVPVVVSPVCIASSPSSLYALTAVLLAAEIVNLEDMLPYMQPNLEETTASAVVKETALRAEIRNCGAMNLTNTDEAPSGAGGRQFILGLASPTPPIPFINQSTQGHGAPSHSSTPLNPVGGFGLPIAPGLFPTPAPYASGRRNVPVNQGHEPLISSSLPSTQASMKMKETALKAAIGLSVVEDVEPFAGGNQIIGLISALLSVRCWNLAYTLILLLQTTTIDVMQFPAVREAMSDFLLWATEGVYHPISFIRLKLTGPKKGPSTPIDGIKRLVASPEAERSLLKKQQMVPYKSMTELMSDITPVLSVMRHHISGSVELYIRVCRLFEAHIRLIAPKLSAMKPSLGSRTPTPPDAMHEDTRDEELLLQPAVDMIEISLLPGLTVSKYNSIVPRQLWRVLAVLPFQIRFALYDSWRGVGLAKEGLGVKHSQLVFAETEALHGTKYHLKRLAKENVKAVGLKLMFFSETSPIVVYNHVLNQIESYDNLIPYMVDALESCSTLSNDVMAYCIINQLGKDSEKLKKGDTHYSSWFSALGKFTAIFFKKYPHSELKGLFQFLLKQLSAGQSLDLLILKELLGRMGGCDTLIEMSAEQLEGMSGGRHLRSESMSAATRDIVKAGHETVKPAKILRDAFLNSGTAIPMLLLIAQIRSRILYCMDTTQLKLISHLYDTAQDVLMQFTDFLMNGVRKMDEISRIMPTMRHLLETVGLSVPVAFQLARPLMRAAFQKSIDPTSDLIPLDLKPWHPFGVDMIATVQAHLSDEVWQKLSPTMYMSFWAFSLYDINVPVKKYEAELKRLKDKSKVLLMSPPPPTTDKKANQNRSEDTKRLLTAISDLTSEMNDQHYHVQAVKSLMLSIKDTFFAHVGNHGSVSIVDTMLQHCMLERVLLSPVDAVYCTQFALLFNELDVPQFATVPFMSKFVYSMTPLVFCSTEAEAGFIGHALNEILTVTQGWDEMSDASYEQLSSKKAFKLNNTGQDGEDSSASFTKLQLDKVIKLMHKRLLKLLMECLSCEEYMYLRAGMIVLSKIIKVFPIELSAGRPLSEKIEQIVKRESARGDLQIMARSIGSMLKKQSSTWIDDEPKKKIPAATSAAATATVDTTKGRKTDSRDSRDRRDVKESVNEKEKDKDKDRERDREKDRDKEDKNSSVAPPSKINNRDDRTRDRDRRSDGPVSSTGTGLRNRDPHPSHRDSNPMSAHSVAGLKRKSTELQVNSSHTNNSSSGSGGGGGGSYSHSTTSNSNSNFNNNSSSHSNNNNSGTYNNNNNNNINTNDSYKNSHSNYDNMTEKERERERERDRVNDRDRGDKRDRDRSDRDKNTGQGQSQGQGSGSGQGQGHHSNQQGSGDSGSRGFASSHSGSDTANIDKNGSIESKDKDKERIDKSDKLDKEKEREREKDKEKDKEKTEKVGKKSDKLDKGKERDTSDKADKDKGKEVDRDNEKDKDVEKEKEKEKDKERGTKRNREGVEGKTKRSKKAKEDNSAGKGGDADSTNNNNNNNNNNSNNTGGKTDPIVYGPEAPATVPGPIPPPPPPLAASLSSASSIAKDRRKEEEANRLKEKDLRESLSQQILEKRGGDRQEERRDSFDQPTSSSSSNTNTNTQGQAMYLVPQKSGGRQNNGISADIVGQGLLISGSKGGAGSSGNSTGGGEGGSGGPPPRPVDVRDGALGDQRGGGHYVNKNRSSNNNSNSGGGGSGSGSSSQSNSYASGSNNNSNNSNSNYSSSNSYNGQGRNRNSSGGGSSSSDQYNKKINQDFSKQKKRN